MFMTGRGLLNILNIPTLTVLDMQNAEAVEAEALRPIVLLKNLIYLLIALPQMWLQGNDSETMLPTVNGLSVKTPTLLS